MNIIDGIVGAVTFVILLAIGVWFVWWFFMKDKM